MSNLDIKTFVLTLDNQGFSSFGEFEVVGTYYYNNFPIKVEGSGPFFLSNKETRYQHQVTFNNFGLTSDGYVDLSVSELDQHANLYDLKPTFYGLLAGGREQDVNMFLTRRYQDGGDANLWLRLGDHLTEYLGEVFAETPFADIIGNGTVSKNH